MIFDGLVHPELTGYNPDESATEKAKDALSKQAAAMAHAFPEEALEYANAAGVAAEQGGEGSSQAKEEEFVKVLAAGATQAGRMLGQGRGECAGELERFLKRGASRQRVTKRAGQKCWEAGQLDHAADLFRRAGEYGEALSVTTAQLARLGLAEAEARERLSERGKELQKLALQADKDQLAADNFRRLVGALKLQEAWRLRGRSSEAVSHLQELDFLPRHPSQAPRLAHEAERLHHSLRQHLEGCLLAGGEALVDLARRGDPRGEAKTRLDALLAFASRCPVPLPSSLYNRLADLAPC